MPSKTYPFLKLPGRPPGPYLPLIVSNPERTGSALIWGLLDTGADTCLFPRQLATSLGHNLKADPVKRKKMGGVGQGAATVYFHTFGFGLLSPDGKVVVRQKEKVLVGCSDRDDLPPLLGQGDFLNGFRVTLDYRLGTTTLEWKVKRKKRKQKPTEKS